MLPEHNVVRFLKNKLDFPGYQIALFKQYLGVTSKKKQYIKDIIQTGGWVVNAFSNFFLITLFLKLGGGKSLFNNEDPTYF